MTEKQILQMLKGIIRNVDYDIYKGLFVNPEEPDFAKEQIDDLVAIVKNHLEQ
jgi:hypothetical protein